MEVSRDAGLKADPPLLRPMSRAKRWAAGAGLLIAILSAVAAWSYFSPWFELARLQRAVAAGDAATVMSSVDRVSIREKLVIKLATEALRAAGLQPGDERVSQVIFAIEATVDELMKPESLAKMMEQAKGSGGGMRVEGGYLSMGVFVFAIENNATHGALTLRMRRMGPFSWVLDELIFLTPEQLGRVPG